jgi:hypothetical protein
MPSEPKLLVIKHPFFLKHKQKINKIENMAVPSYLKKINFIMMKSFFILIFLILSAFNIKAQETNTFYYMRLSPQSNHLNPSFQNDCNFYIGLPVLSSTLLDLSPPLKITDILYKKPGNDSTFTFLYSLESQKQFFDKLHNAPNFLSLNAHFDLFSFGFRIKKLYFSFDVMLKNNISLNIPSDLAQFVLQGNLVDDGNTYKNYNITKFGVNANSYIETGFGFSYQVLENLYIGIRPKIYQGILDITTSNQNFVITSSDTSISINANTDVNGSIPFLKLEDNNRDGLADTIYFDIPNNPTSAINDILKNRGFGVDLGATYNLNRFFSIYASILDLGRIKWNYNPYNMNFTINYSYKGIEIPDDFFNINKTNENTSTEGQNITDSIINGIKNSIQKSFTTSPYYTFLPTKLYLGATISPLKFIDFGILSRSYIKRKSFQQQVSISAVIKTKKSFNGILSYTLGTGGFDNIGIGFCWRMGPFNSYFVTDKSILLRYRVGITSSKIDLPSQLPVALLSVPNSLRINYRFGFNLMIGSKKKKEAKIDKPIIF